MVDLTDGIALGSTESDDRVIVLNDLVKLIARFERDLIGFRDGGDEDVSDVELYCYIDIFTMRAVLDKALGFDSKGAFDSLVKAVGNRALSRVTVKSMKAYLDQRGWRCVDKFGCPPYIWVHSDPEDRRIYVPKADLDMGWRDSILHFIRELASSEGRPEIEVYSDLIAIRE